MTDCPIDAGLPVDSVFKSAVITGTGNYYLAPAGAFVSTAGKLLVAGALAGPPGVPPASLVLELVDCVSVELTGLF